MKLTRSFVLNEINSSLIFKLYFDFMLRSGNFIFTDLLLLPGAFCFVDRFKNSMNLYTLVFTSCRIRFLRIPEERTGTFSRYQSPE